MKLEGKMRSRESDVFVPRPKQVSQAKSRIAQLIATIAFGMMVLSVGSLLTVPTILVGALYKLSPTQNISEQLTSSSDLFPLSSTMATEATSTQSGQSTSLPNENDTVYQPSIFPQGITSNLLDTQEMDVDELYEDEIQLTEKQASWLGSVMYVVQPVGSIVSGFIQNHIGRRNGMMATSVVQLIGWISLYFCTNVTSLFCAAVLMGLSIGFMEAPGLSFLGEVIEPRYRGSFANIAMNMWLLGVLVIYLFGAVLTWRYVCLASTAIPIINFVILCMIPESPVFLLLQGKERQAEASLRWLRGWTDHDTIRDEYETLVESLHIPRKCSGAYLTPTAQHGAKVPRKVEKSQLAMLCERRVFFPIFLLASLFFVQHCVALAGVKPFLVNIFQSYNMQLSPNWILVYSGVLQLIGIVILTIAISYTGKRMMALVSVIASTFICLLLSIYVYMNPGYPIIPMVLFGINYLANGLGIMSMPWILVAEVFPTECRGSAAGIAAASSYLLGFVVTITFKPIEAGVSLGGCLLIYTAVGVIGTIFIYYKLPETEGKTLIDIEQLFKGKVEHENHPKGHYY